MDVASVELLTIRYVKKLMAVLVISLIRRDVLVDLLVVILVLRHLKVLVVNLIILADEMYSHYQNFPYLLNYANLAITSERL